ncbi:MAG: hypothetical protein GTO54_06250, partial [Nitrososphaeria archaeon]|nr:hypothetical protein [Nitrososphaeria archaeon]
MKRASNTRKLAVLAVVVIVALASVGVWYYLAIYMPQYEEERIRLLTLFTSGVPADLDPALAIDLDSLSIIYNVYDRLVAYKRGTTEVEPCLAASWETPDSMTYIFNLREDVVFHDGTSFDAESVKYSLDRALELEGPLSYILDFINKTEVLDTYRVKVTLDFDFAPFLSIMAHPVASIVSPDAVERYGEDFNKNPVGTGPFMFDSWSLGKEVVLTANKEYFRGAPKLERLVFKTILEAAARKDALEQGEVDVLWSQGEIAPADLADVEANPDIRTFKASGTAIECLGFNLWKKPLNDSKVREAISYAIDYDTIIMDAMDGRAERVGGPIPPDIFGYKPLALRQRDVARARQLLDEAGYSEGFDISLTYNIESLERRKVAEVMRNSLGEIGINVKIKGLDWDSTLDELDSMEHDMFLINWIPDYFDPDSYLFPQFHSASLPPNGANNFGLSDPEIDTILDDGVMTTDPSQRLEAYHKAQERIVEEMPC